MPDVYQFIHPGPEHGEDRPGFKGWNRGDHRRKFLRSRGRYVPRLGAPAIDEELVFWGEWEPESEVETIVRPLPGGPQWLHRPYYVRPARYSPAPGVVLQNTDPFVFGDRFQYTFCRQLRRHRKEGPYFPTGLRNTTPGSLILFGSAKKGLGFLLDTAFVVADEGVLHSLGDWKERLAGRITETYAEVTIAAGYGWEAVQPPFRHQVGATPASPIDGMFSFVPALPYAEAPDGFARPVIRLEGIVNPGLLMGAKRTSFSRADEVRDIWERIVEQVTAAGLGLGTHFDLPQRREV